MDALVPQVAERLGRGPDGESLATADDLDAIRRDLLEHEGLAEALRGIWPALTAAAAAGGPVRLAGADRLCGKPFQPRRPETAGTAERRGQLDARRRAAAGRGGRAARPGRPGATGRRRRRRPGVRRRGARPDGRVLGSRTKPTATRHLWCRMVSAANLAVAAQRRGDDDVDGRTRCRGPRVGLRARHRRRGAGAVADGLADGDAPLPGPLDDAGRRPGPDLGRGRRLVLGSGAETLCTATAADRGADGQLPHPGRDHGRRRADAGPDRPGGQAAAIGARIRCARPGTARSTPRNWRT